jgi:hypothetical protein
MRFVSCLLSTSSPPLLHFWSMLRAFRSACYHPLPRASLFPSTSSLTSTRSTLYGSPTRLPTPRSLSTTTVSSDLQPKRKSRKKIVVEDDLEVEQDEKPVPQQVVLRPYQVECIKAVLDELQTGSCTRLGVSAPTGALPPLRARGIR